MKVKARKCEGKGLVRETECVKAGEVLTGDWLLVHVTCLCEYV